MKYLKYDLYEKASAPGGKIYEAQWNDQLTQYYAEFNSFAYRLPKRFVKEMNEHDMHDCTVKNILIERKKWKKYDVEIHLTDYSDDNIEHMIKLINVNVFKSDLDFRMSGISDWIYCELLAIDDKRMSLEVILFDESSIYCEFSKLQYKKFQVNN